MTLSFPIPTLGLLPHEKPMHLIHEVLSFSGSPVSGVVSAKIEEGGPYMGPIGFEAHWLIEFSAQASAAIYFLARCDSHRAPPRGYIVSMREFLLLEDLDLRAGDELKVEVLFEVDATPLGQSRCLVYKGDKAISTAEISFLIETEG